MTGGACTPSSGRFGVDATAIMTLANGGQPRYPMLMTSKQAAASATSVADTIGAHVRTLRKRKKLTLEQLSELTGISISSLSRLENTQLGITMEKVDLLAKALAVSPEDLVSRSVEETETRRAKRTREGPRFIVDRARQREESRDREVSARYLFRESEHRALECMRCSIEPVSIWDTEFIKHSGEKIIYVIEGDAVVYCQGKSPIILETGDAIYMDADVWHSFVAVNGRPVELLVTYFHDESSRNGLFELKVFTAANWAALQPS